jgi:hypothetical protein
MKFTDQHVGPTKPQISDPPKRTSTRKRSTALANKQKSQVDAVGGPVALRERTLANAGYSDERLAEITRVVVDGAVDDAQNATVTQRLVVGTGRGTAEVQEFTDPDYRARAAARNLLVDIVGVKASKSMSGVVVKGPTTINVEFRQRPPMQQATIVAVEGANPDAIESGRRQLRQGADK